MKIKLEGIEIECNVDEFEEIRKRNLLGVNIDKISEVKTVDLSEIVNSVVSVFLKYGIKYTQKKTESEKLLEFRTVEIENNIIRIIFIQPNEVKIFRQFACAVSYSVDDMIVEDEEKLKRLEDILADYIQEILKIST